MVHACYSPHASIQNNYLKNRTGHKNIFTIHQNTTDKKAPTLLPMQHISFIHKFKDIVQSIASEYSTTHHTGCTSKHFSLKK